MALNMRDLIMRFYFAAAIRVSVRPISGEAQSLENN